MRKATSGNTRSLRQGARRLTSPKRSSTRALRAERPGHAATAKSASPPSSKGQARAAARKLSPSAVLRRPTERMSKCTPVSRG
jgi:hypothetical protein